MREKRPRISDSRGFKERLENNLSDNASTDQSEINTYNSQSVGQLPDIEMDELWHKKSYDPIKITDFPISLDLVPKEHLDDSEVNTEILNDIYNSFTLDDTL